MPLHTDPDLTSFFVGEVERACEGLGFEVAPAARVYLVELLVRYASPDPDRELDRPLALLLVDATDEPDPTRRFVRFRSLGDAALMIGGFFQELVEARGITIDYVSAIGARAYANAEALVPGGRAAAPVYRTLAVAFRPLVRVVAEVREATSHETPMEVLRLYESFLRGGSPRVARKLAALGVAPAAGRRRVLH